MLVNIAFSTPNPETVGNPVQETKAMEGDDGTPMFAFQNLDYIPSGFGGSEAPYIETPAATMRAAATLMRLGLSVGPEVVSTHREAVPTVVCDLGCGDGYFRMDRLLSLLFTLPCMDTPALHRHLYSDITDLAGYA
jgi:hypothetical protein